MRVPSEKELLLAACHFGHPKQKWNPKMAPYIYGVHKGVHIFDLGKTREHLEKAVKALSELHSAGKSILFVSTKQQSVPLIEKLAQNLGQPMVTKRWIPGLITNWPTLKRRLQYYLDLKKSFQTGEVEKYTKKEQTQLRKKMIKLEAALGGVAGMSGLPHALFVVDAIRDHVAVLEAKKLNIPVYGICDSNANPDEFTVCIPCNDDASKAIELVLTTVEQALSSRRSAAEEPEVKPVAA